MNDHLLTCPFCKTPIPDDCIYCDVCGERLRWCPSCASYAKAKRCAHCGQPTVETNPAAKSCAAPKAAMPGHLEGVSADIRLGIGHEAVIGRRGSYGAVFQQFPSVSGLHAKLLHDAGQWKIEDIGSTCGTFLNGTKLQPHQPTDISVGDVLKFADIEFKVVE